MADSSEEEDKPSRRTPEEFRAENTQFLFFWFKRVLIASVVFFILVALGVVDLARDLIENVTGWRPGG